MVHVERAERLHAQWCEDRVAARPIRAPGRGPVGAVGCRTALFRAVDKVEGDLDRTEG